ncbi:hypothetical protein [Streptomyces sp. cmx-4-9]|uniref:hypothetical protein n=1 Tax=Streptomyces sp. cmx-4-9 TaxID=2790941 RepID=UPI00398128C3
MGHVKVNKNDLSRVLADSQGIHRMPYQLAFAQLADHHHGRPVTEIIPLLKTAARRAHLDFTDADLQEQAEAIRTGRSYNLRITVT